MSDTELGFLGATASALIRQQTKGQYPAPPAVLELMLESSQLPIEEALQKESEGFAQLFGSPINRALINVFFMTDRNKRDTGLEKSDATPRELKSVGVIGAGIMGAGIAEASLKREFTVALTAMRGFMTINGRAFLGNTPVFRAKVGERVRWNVMTLGDDFHTFHVHGHRWRTPGGAVRDTQVIGPAESYKIRWREDAPGTWLYHCHVESHMMNGMIGIYRVTR
jgi:FtsP/CotA-like multicopper oxidase with cupredoxin domain